MEITAHTHTDQEPTPLHLRVTLTDRNDEIPVQLVGHERLREAPAGKEQRGITKQVHTGLCSLGVLF